MFVNIIKSYRDIVVVCDEELIGKKFEYEKFQLDIKENFYKGEKKNQKEVIVIMKKFASEDATFNIVGEKAVAAALKAEIITKDEIGKIQGVPFALVLI